MQRRDALHALASVVVAAAAGACGGANRAPAQATAELPRAQLHVAPATDLVAAPALVWLVDARPREIFANVDLIPAVHLLLSEQRLDTFAERNGGVDLRQLQEIAVASYPDATLFIGRGMFEPARLEKAFRARTANLDGRARDDGRAPDGTRLASITRMWGSAGTEREQLAILGREAMALERGRFGPLRVAEAFAQQKLKRAKPALRGAPLARAAELLGDAPMRGFAPGPFDGEWAQGLGGLLKASTAFGISVHPKSARLEVKVVLLGGWGADAASAAQYLSAEYQRLAQVPIGRLCGLDKPLDGPRVRGGDDALVLEASLDALTVARGLRAMTGASIDEIMAH